MADKRVLGESHQRSVVDPNAGTEIMRLSYGQITRLLTHVLRVDKGKATALSGRLKHFQRARFPGAPIPAQDPAPCTGWIRSSR